VPIPRGQVLITALTVALIAATTFAFFPPTRAARAEELSPARGYALLSGLMSEQTTERQAAAAALIAAGDRSLIPGLVDALFFIPKTRRAEAFEALSALSGEQVPALYLDWVETVGAHPEWRPKAGYGPWKANLLARIDPTYAKIFYPGAPVRIRLEEIVSGGVGFEGIPALDRPTTIPATKAGYLHDDEKVFGVRIGGEARAYPLRMLDWHEMLNDEVGGRPVTLSYCTLCGSGILYDTRTPNGKPYTFGTSGLLYRSNKLMVDRQTLSLWNNLTGEPVVGRLAQSAIRLPILPLTLTTWKEWRGRHPDSTTFALDAALVGRFGFNYQPGAADRQRRGVSFPVWNKSAALDPKAEVFALRLGDPPKVYPVETLIAERLVNDRVGDTAVVLLADPESGAVRAFARGDRTFRLAPGGELLDQDDRRWRIEEEALSSEAQKPLERLAGHQAFWFGWYGFYPGSEIYRGRAGSGDP
jgi:hypothetical protein